MGPSRGMDQGDQRTGEGVLCTKGFSFSFYVLEVAIVHFGRGEVRYYEI